MDGSGSAGAVPTVAKAIGESAIERNFCALIT
jgi:hypothetical protein